MVKVLFMVDELAQRSGVTSIIMNYYRNIDERNIWIDFLVSKTEPKYKEEIEGRGHVIHYMPSLQVSKTFIFVRAMTSFFSDHGTEYDILHSHINILDSIVFPIARKKGINHCISHSHSTIFSHKLINSIRNKLMCLPIEMCATDYFACSIEAGQHLFPHKSLNDIYVLHNAIDTDRFIFDREQRTKIREQFGINQNEFVVGHVGRFYPIKNQRFIVDLISKMNDERYKLMLVGDGEDKAELEKYVKEIGVDNRVIFLGNRNDVNLLLSAFDIFVMPSLSEGLPVTVVEAQATGLPCLLSDSITTEVKITELVEYKSINAAPEQWISVLFDMINANQDFRETQEALLTAAGYNIRVEAQKLEQHYIRLVEEGKS